jgi:hypothetical protein
MPEDDIELFGKEAALIRRNGMVIQDYAGTARLKPDENAGESGHPRGRKHSEADRALYDAGGVDLSGTCHIPAAISRKFNTPHSARQKHNRHFVTMHRSASVFSNIAKGSETTEDLSFPEHQFPG